MNSDVIATRIITNFHFYLIQLCWQFFQLSVYGVVVYAQKNFTGIDPEKLYRSTFICQYGLFCCMALVSFRLFCKNLGNLEEFFGQMDYRPPWQKIARTPMCFLYFFFKFSLVENKTSFSFLHKNTYLVVLKENWLFLAC